MKCDWPLDSSAITSEAQLIYWPRFLLEFSSKIVFYSPIFFQVPFVYYTFFIIGVLNAHNFRKICSTLKIEVHEIRNIMIMNIDDIFPRF